MQASSLEQRRERIRLPTTEIAKRARVDKFTARRCLHELRDTRSSKAAAIEQAIRAEELDLLTHLVRQHPDEARALIAA